jgi:enamine deaminase RidA (YjgF/YER057c/UK114 family)
LKPPEFATVLGNNSHLNFGRLIFSEERLGSAGIVLPVARPPIANFVGGVQEGNLLFLSGQGPVTPEGKKVGKVGRDVTAEEAYGHARLAGLNLLSQMLSTLGSLDRVSRVVKVFGMVDAADDFMNHPAVINGCSDLLVEVFGETGRHDRSAIGVSSLPGGITLEVEAILAVWPIDEASSGRPI